MTTEMFDPPCLADSDPEDRDDGSLITDQLLEALRVAARATTNASTVYFEHCDECGALCALLQPNPDPDEYVLVCDLCAAAPPEPPERTAHYGK